MTYARPARRYQPLRRLTPCLVALGVVFGLAAPAAAAAPNPAFASKAATAAGHPVDLSGVWEIPAGGTRAFDSTVKSPFDEKPPFKAPWDEEYRIIKKRFQAGMRVWDGTVRCLPPGMPRTMNASYPFEILMTPGRVTVLTEFFNETRRIWTDGRKHPGPEDLEPTFSGDSVAHWEGDTLVIDTVGLRYETTVDLVMVPHSDQLRITERVRRIKPDELEWTITLTDPVVFAQPWTSVKHYVRSPPGTPIREYVCAENAHFDPYEPSPDDEKYMKPDPRLKTMP